MYLSFFFFLPSPLLTFLSITSHCVLASLLVNKTKLFSQPPVSLSCFTSCQSVNLCRHVAVTSVCGCTLCVRVHVERSCMSPCFFKRPPYIFSVISVAWDVLSFKNGIFSPLSVICPSVAHSIPPTCLHDWMFCVSLFLPGSENRRNKLQGMMSDFPPKPTPPPSVSGQARAGEGKSSLLKTLHRKP